MLRNVRAHVNMCVCGLLHGPTGQMDCMCLRVFSATRKQREDGEGGQQSNKSHSLRNSRNMYHDSVKSILKGKVEAT